MALAIFDLDNTLIAGDSDHRFGEFLCAEGLVDPSYYAEQNDRFYADYQSGDLDIFAYLEFALGPMKGKTIEEVAELQTTFMAHWIEPILIPAAFELIAQHRNRGDRLMIITATNTLVTRPIARRLGIDTLLGCEAEVVDGVYTGRATGVPSFAEGKVKRLNSWLSAEELSMSGAFFYSDSHNDLPLLEQVDNPVAVDPDEKLESQARDRGWPILSLRL